MDSINIETGKRSPETNSSTKGQSPSYGGQALSGLDLAGDKAVFGCEEEEVYPCKHMACTGFKVSLVVGYFAYLIAAMTINFERAKTVFILTMLVLAYYGYYLFKTYRKSAFNNCSVALITNWNCFIQNSYIMYGIVGAILLGFFIWLCFDISDDVARFQSLGGMLVMIFLLYAFSWKRSKIKWRPVIGGLALQWIFALLILRWDAGYAAFDALGKEVIKFLNYTNAGSSFVFGDLIPFAFTVVPTVIFFGAVVAVFFYLGALQWIIVRLAWAMRLLLGTSCGESVNATANIFIGMVEAPLLIAPFLERMSTSEVHAIMTAGFATIAGGVLAIYISFQIPAQHLIAASVMSAPAALAVSKLLYPEEEEIDGNEGYEDKIEEAVSPDVNVLGAASRGAIMAIPLAANIVAMIISFLAILAWVNATLSYCGALVDYPELSFEKICGWILWPFAFLMGVPVKDCEKVGALLGLKTFANEFVAYLELSKYKANGTLDERSIVISTYALCGFANFGSIGILLGGLIPLAPKRSKEFSQIVFSAMIGGTIACFLTASIAGVLYK